MKNSIIIYILLLYIIKSNEQKSIIDIPNEEENDIYNKKEEIKLESIKEEIKLESIKVNINNRNYMKYIPFISVIIIIFYNFYITQTNNDILDLWLTNFRNNNETKYDLNKDQSFEFKSTTYNQFELILNAKNDIIYLFDFHLLIRGDLMISLWNKINNNNDKIILNCFVKKSCMDNFIFFIGRKSQLINDEKFGDIKNICNESIDSTKYGFNKFISILSDSTDIANYLLHHNIFNIIKENMNNFHYLLISDISNNTKYNDCIHISLCFTLTCSYYLTHNLLDLTNLINTFPSLISHVVSIRVSRDTKVHIEKSRSKYKEGMNKLKHDKKIETAMKMKNDKMKAMKQEMMDELDPNIQLKMKEKLDKLEAKDKNKKLMKSKMIKVIA